MMSLWDALRMNMMISYQELVRTFPKSVESLDLDGKCTVLFVITSPGAIRDAVQELVFQYQGTGDPLAEAEAVLRVALIP
ncbi:hypothetical protein AGG09_21225 [Klebsiella pneumoniae]|nr:hypothetical protein AB186_21125 [Klebsiella pneumoniae]ALR26646.1 hypothetical protein AGG09_21225 [Klebsiella pneumoniae]